MRVADDLKPHNRETIRRILEFYKTERKCCAIQATGTGKTFLILRLLEILNDEGKVAVIFAPNNEIIKQTKKRMKKFGLSNASFYTYQKLSRMTEEEISAIEADLIICDELHRTGAKTWGQKFEQLVNLHPDSKVFGVTATPLRCADGRDMAEEYFDGNKACDISLAEALVREIIPVMPIYVSALYTFEEEYQNMSDKISKANNSDEEKDELQKELLAAKQQLEKANGVPEIIKKYITNYNGKYIVFCKDIEHLYAMKDVVIGWFRESGYDGEIFEYPYYSKNSKVKKNLYDFEKNEEEGLKLLFVIDKLNEGLHLEEIDGCILLRTTTSNIIYYQQIGRSIDAGSMNKRVILDLVSNFNNLKSFNLKDELREKMSERKMGKFYDCSVEFEIDKFYVIDCVQECIDIFNNIDKKICNDWDFYMTALKQFYMREGHTLVPQHHIEIYQNNEVCLGQFVADIRRSDKGFFTYSWLKLNSDQRKQLDEMGFVYELAKEKFIYKINLVKEYMKIKKCRYDSITRNCKYKNENIGGFIAMLSRNMKKGTYNKKNECWKLPYVKSIGILEENKSEVKYKYLCNLYKKLISEYSYIPNNYVDEKYKMNVAKWVSQQKGLYAKGKLTEERRLLLENVGFDFMRSGIDKPSVKGKRVAVFKNEKLIKIYDSISSLCNNSQNDFGEYFNTGSACEAANGIRNHIYKGYTLKYVS